MSCTAYSAWVALCISLALFPIFAIGASESIERYALFYDTLGIKVDEAHSQQRAHMITSTTAISMRVKAARPPRAFTGPEECTAEASRLCFICPRLRHTTRRIVNKVLNSDYLQWGADVSAVYIIHLVASGYEGDSAFYTYMQTVRDGFGPLLPADCLMLDKKRVPRRDSELGCLWHRLS